MRAARGGGCEGDEKASKGEEDEEWSGAAAGVVTGAAIGDVAEEEVARLPACGRKPEKVAQIDLAEVEDSREIERGGVEAEG